ncbi:exodeoxyribonuclease VII large subunit [Aquibaculum sediminis]|uniref:exodeoxyribonuclease VII large subunit n=1 Tax=Aquibaculum sediminis TaxID=3231907 RepID=UPI0034570980
MSETYTTPGLQPERAGANLPELTVSEISGAIKRTLESAFDRVRVRGEISGFKRAASGHCYMALKDDRAVLDAVCWRGTAQRLSIQPEDGLEVIATGRITSYAGRSKYQMVIDSLELAGEGALLKLLEERKRKLGAEGLFAPERKRALPFLPEVIGVVTSPSGAVIRDILHRLAERFPRRVLVWPVLVQGQGAAEQVAEAIRGFNALPAKGPVPRPDLLIVARGGGSLEDLWAFNEEIVVRAAAESAIPLISAVGHETDTTLIDFASDRRAPTPTAAAEIAVPVRSELQSQVLDFERRLLGSSARQLVERRNQVEGLARGLPDPQRLLQEKTQSLDDRSERLQLAGRSFLDRRGAELESLGHRLPHPRQQLRYAQQALDGARDRLTPAMQRLVTQRRQLVERLRPLPPRRELAHAVQTLAASAERLEPAMRRIMTARKDTLEASERLLETLSYKGTLERGYAVVRGPKGLQPRAKGVRKGDTLRIEFFDGAVSAVASGDSAPNPPPAKSSTPEPESPPETPNPPPKQGKLL